MGIYKGQIAVPTLSYKESLELFIDLGLEKLKNDYLCICNHFCMFPQDLLLAYWK